MMISIVQHIEYLMMYNDCMVIPGWGALIANYTSSAVSGNKFCRPARVITFNSQIKHNDGLLATSLTRRHGITYDEACQLIADSVTAFRQQLASGTEVAMGNLGYFVLNDAGKMEFVPLSHNYARDEFFGLSDFEFMSMRQATGEPLIAITPITWQERMKVAASIAAIVGVGLLLSTPIIIDKAAQTASLVPTQIKAKPTTAPITIKPANKTTAADNKITVLDDNKTPKPITTTQEHESMFNEGMPSDTHGCYLLVINSCKKHSQAEQIAKRYEQQGIKSRVVSRKGYYHVVVAQSNNEKKLWSAKKQLPSKFKKAWVCK